MDDTHIIRYIAIAFIPSLSRSILSKEATSFIEIIAESVLSSFIAGGLALFVFSLKQKDEYGVFTSIIGGSIGVKKLTKIAEKILDKNIK